MFTKVALPEVPPLSLVAARLALGATALGCVLALLPAPDAKPGAGWKAVPGTVRLRLVRDCLGLGVLNAALPLLLITWGQQWIASGLAGMYHATIPLFTALIAHFLTDDRFTALRGLGIGAGFLGVAILLDVGSLDMTHASVRGQLAVLAGMLCYALAASYARRAFRGIAPAVPALGQTTAGALLLAPLALWLDAPAAWPSSWALASVLALGLGPTALAQLLYFWLLARVGPTRTVLVTYLTPPMAVFYGWALLGEQFGPRALGGLAVILMGIAPVARPPRTQPAGARDPERRETIERAPP